MASSPAKRRKLSPSKSMAPADPTTPSRISAPRDSTRTTPVRPSFASPTKASIAKHHPQLLGRPKPDGNDTETDQGKENAPVDIVTEPVVPAQEVIDENFTESGVNGGSTTVVQTNGNATPPRALERPLSTPGAGGGLSAPPRRRSRTPGKDIREPLAPMTAPPAVIRDAGSAHAAGSNVPARLFGLRNSSLEGQVGSDFPADPPGSTSVKDFVVIPEPGAGTLQAELDTVQDPFRKTGLRRSPIASQPEDRPRERAQSEENAEPELPLTPTQRGLADPVVTTAPTGIHNTPSKRQKRRPRTSKPKSSPLKPQAETEAEAPEKTEVTLKRKRFVEVDPPRIFNQDPHSDKRRLRDQLRKEVEQWEADVALAERESERLRKQSRSKKQIDDDPSISDDILDLLTRATAPDTPITPPPKPSVLQSINSFLPFAKRRRPPITPPVSATPPATHLPITSPDTLNHLKLFTPLQFSSSVFLLPPTPPTSPNPSATLLQSHNITATAPSGLFKARFSMIVNTSTFAITSLQLEKIDPFADAELGTWIRERAEKGILGRDVNAISWAMGRWYEVAIRRAKFWLVLEEELGGLEARKKSIESLYKSAKKGGTRMVENAEDLGDDNAVADSVAATLSSRRKWERKQILSKMGARGTKLGDERVKLIITWDIGFDWTGEAESDIKARAELPTSWHDADERNSLAKIPETFDSRLRSHGPLAAARTLVALLFKD